MSPLIDVVTKMASLLNNELASTTTIKTFVGVVQFVSR
jgi:hypothetical protein